MTTTYLNPGANVGSAISSASAGDIISLNSGNYGDQEFSVAKTNPGVTIQSTTGQGAIISLDPYRCAYLTFKNLTIPNCEVEDHGGSPASNHLTFQNCLCSGSSAFWNWNLEGQSNASHVVDGCTFTGGYNSGGFEAQFNLRANPYSSANRGVTIRNCFFGGGGGSDGLRLDTNGIYVGPGNIFQDKLQAGYTVHVDSVQIYGGNNITINGNFWKNNTINIGCYDAGNAITVTNNVFDTPDQPDASWQHFQLSMTNVVFSHNTIRHALFGIGAKSGDPICANWVVQNNLLIHTDLGPGGDQPGIRTPYTLSHNLVDPNSSFAPTQTNGVSGTPVFIGGTNPSTWAGFRLAAGSPGKNAGSDGSDIGTLYYGPEAIVDPPTGTLVLEVH